MIVENNCLIANFLGWKKFEGFNYITPFYQDYISVGHSIEQTSVYSFDELRFHKSWDWLMVVLEKIKDMYQERILVLHRFSIGMHYVMLKVEYNKDVFKQEYPVNKSALEPTYNLILEFIKWYNDRRTS